MIVQHLKSVNFSHLHPFQVDRTAKNSLKCVKAKSDDSDADRTTIAPFISPQNRLPYDSKQPLPIKTQLLAKAYTFAFRAGSHSKVWHWCSTTHYRDSQVSIASLTAVYSAHLFRLVHTLHPSQWSSKNEHIWETRHRWTAGIHAALDRNQNQIYPIRLCWGLHLLLYLGPKTTGRRHTK